MPGASTSTAAPSTMPPRPPVKFCSACGAERIELRVPEGDTLPRHVCAACGSIHYQNPKIVVGCLPEIGDQVLLCLRAIEPRRGLWTLPAGFLENGETLEEANAHVAIGSLYTIISLPHISQIYMPSAIPSASNGIHFSPPYLRAR